MSDLSAIVRAQVTIEICVGTWSGASTFDDLQEQAAREATAMILNKLSDKGLQVIGEPVLKVVVFSKAAK